MSLCRRTDGSSPPDSPRDRCGKTVPGPGMDYDADWRERIALAGQIREESKKARAGRPLTFRMSGTLHLPVQTPAMNGNTAGATASRVP